MRFLRLHSNTLTARDIIELSQEKFDSLAFTNPNKAALLRVLVTDPLPSFNPAIEKVEAGSIIVEATQARETWQVVPKTADDLEQDDLENELAQVTARINNLGTAISDYQAILDVPYSEPTKEPTNGAEIDALRVRMRQAERNFRDVYRDLILVMRSTRWILRRIRSNPSSSASSLSLLSSGSSNASNNNANKSLSAPSAKSQNTPKGKSV